MTGLLPRAVGIRVGISPSASVEAFIVSICATDDAGSGRIGSPSGLEEGDLTMKMVSNESIGCFSASIRAEDKLAALRKRCAGSLARQRRITASSAGGRAGLMLLGEGGGVLIC